jgi:predicted DNA-binding transcriptional regulator YafY
MKRKKAERLFCLANLLCSGKGYRAAELAEVLGVSERTIYRDVVDLSDLVPIYYDKGYRVMREFRPTDAAFTRRELLAMRLVFKTMELVGGNGFLTPIMRAALSKIENRISDSSGGGNGGNGDGG